MELSKISPAFATALVGAQGEIEGAKKGKVNPQFRSKYADLASCWDACREALQNHSIAVLQYPSHSAPGYVGVTGVLVYGPTGESLSETYSVPLKDPTNAQALGSAITYGRRYQLCAMIGICPEDDDGNAASRGRQKEPSAGRESADVREPAAGTGPSTCAHQVPGDLVVRFIKAKSRDDMKAVYAELKNMNIDETAKTKVLNEWADVIKGVK